MYKRCQEIAARMLGERGDPGMLNYRLAQKLELIDNLCARAGAELLSKEVIATIVLNWIENESNGERAYGD